jgi:hypothetical protein
MLQNSQSPFKVLSFALNAHRIHIIEVKYHLNIKTILTRAITFLLCSELVVDGDLIYKLL